MNAKKEKTMKRKAMSRLVLAAIMLSASAPACSSHPDVSSEVVGRVSAADADTEGRLCATTEGGLEYCVLSSQDPAGAWNQAAAANKPIQMYAKWPGNVTLDQLVSDVNKLRAWFADIDKVISYVRDTKKSAESYRATTAGPLAALLKKVKDRQAQLLAQPVVDPIGNFKKALNDKANAEKGPIVAELAVDKQTIGAINALVDQAKNDIVFLEWRYQDIASAFKAYRATEADETAHYTNLAHEASQSTLETIDRTEQAVVTAARDASTKPNDLILDAMRLSAEMTLLSLNLQRALQPYAAFMAAHGAVVPDMTSGALRSLNAMLAYTQARTVRSDATANNLLQGMVVRRQALIALRADEATRDTIAQSRLLSASTAFNNEATARIAALWNTPPMSTKLRLPYLADRYDQFTTFLQIQPLCDATSSAWRETGCIALRRHFTTAQSYKTRTIPSLITMGIATMRTKGVDPALLDAASAKLTAGDVRAAASVYDAAVHSSEGT